MNGYMYTTPPSGTTFQSNSAPFHPSNAAAAATLPTTSMHAVSNNNATTPNMAPSNPTMTHNGPSSMSVGSMAMAPAPGSNSNNSQQQVNNFTSQPTVSAIFQPTTTTTTTLYSAPYPPNTPTGYYISSHPPGPVYPPNMVPTSFVSYPGGGGLPPHPSGIGRYPMTQTVPIIYAGPHTYQMPVMTPYTQQMTTQTVQSQLSLLSPLPPTLSSSSPSPSPTVQTIDTVVKSTPLIESLVANASVDPPSPLFKKARLSSSSLKSPSNTSLPSLTPAFTHLLEAVVDDESDLAHEGADALKSIAAIAASASISTADLTGRSTPTTMASTSNGSNSRKRRSPPTQTKPSKTRKLTTPMPNGSKRSNNGIGSTRARHRRSRSQPAYGSENERDSDQESGVESDAEVHADGGDDVDDVDVSPPATDYDTDSGDDGSPRERTATAPTHNHHGRSSASLLHRSELACGSIRAAPGAKALDFRAVIRCGTYNPKTGTWQNNLMMDYFGKEMDVYTADGDSKRRPLVRASTLADKFNCATNKIGMYLARRRTVMDGIYQATEFTHKPAGKTGLKVGGYFVTVEACRDFESHYWQHKEKKHGPTVPSNRKSGFPSPPTSKRPSNVDSRGRIKKRATPPLTTSSSMAANKKHKRRVEEEDEEDEEEDDEQEQDELDDEEQQDEDVDNVTDQDARGDDNEDRPSSKHCRTRSDDSFNHPTDEDDDDDDGYGDDDYADPAESKGDVSLAPVSGSVSSPSSSSSVPSTPPVNRRTRSVKVSNENTWRTSPAHQTKTIDTPVDGKVKHAKKEHIKSEPTPNGKHGRADSLSSPSPSLSPSPSSIGVTSHLKQSSDSNRSTVASSDGSSLSIETSSITHSSSIAPLPPNIIHMTHASPSETTSSSSNPIGLDPPSPSSSSVLASLARIRESLNQQGPMIKKEPSSSITAIPSIPSIPTMFTNFLCGTNPNDVACTTVTSYPLMIHHASSSPLTSAHTVNGFTHLSSAPSASPIVITKNSNSSNPKLSLSTMAAESNMHVPTPVVQ